MSETIAQAEWLIRAETQALLAAFDKAGEELRFVGGCVRGAVLGRSDGDVDAATPALPETVMALLARANIKAIPTGIEHGTVTAIINHIPYEITTLRRDVSCDGRRAEVAYTDNWQEDASRRDFTMNALYATRTGEVIDYFGGIEDAKIGHVKFIGEAEERISEDALRILRFFRFFAHYGQGDPDPEGLKACAKLAPMLEQLSGERIRSEMMKLLGGPMAARLLTLMRQHGITKYLLPPSIFLGGLATLYHLEQSLGISGDALRRLASLFMPPATEEIHWLEGRWKLSHAERERFTFLRSVHTKFDDDEKAVKRQIRRYGKDGYGDVLLLEAAEKGIRAELVQAKLDFIANWDIPEFPLRGQDLLDAGMSPGKAMGEALATLEEYWEAEDYTPTREALLKRWRQ